MKTNLTCALVLVLSAMSLASCGTNNTSSAAKEITSTPVTAFTVKLTEMDAMNAYLLASNIQISGISGGPTTILSAESITCDKTRDLYCRVVSGHGGARLVDATQASSLFSYISAIRKQLNLPESKTVQLLKFEASHTSEMPIYNSQEKYEASFLVTE